jgi:ornithine carbamoyltransferase
MANSLIVGCIKMGMKIAICCPNDYRPDAALMEWGFKLGMLEVTDDLKKAALGSDVLYTDVWASMGQEHERAKRIKAFSGYQINDEIMSIANEDAIVLHCLPAHKGEEITAEVFEKHADEIFEEAENRLHAQKAVLAKVMGNYSYKNK